MVVYHFLNAGGGGVQSVIRNLLKFSNNSLIENHIIYTINKEANPSFDIPLLEQVISQRIFYYSPKWNFYYSCKRLAKMIPNEKVILVAHDWIELGAVSNLGLQNPVVQVLHGDFDYYYELAIKNSMIVDAFIAVSPKIFESLNDKLPARKDDIFYINFPVPPVRAKAKINHDLHLIYSVRDLNDNRKQFSTILKIANILSKPSAQYFFTIAGGGLQSHEFFELWPVSMKNRVNFLGLVTNEEIISILPDHDIFLLPSTAEGLPVSLIEAMKAGVVPLISRWDGAVAEFVVDGKTGYYFEIGASNEYAKHINMLSANRMLLNQMSDNCILTANNFFDPFVNTEKFETVFINLSKASIKMKNSLKVYGSRLDHPKIPNWLVTCSRKYFTNLTKM